jgi:hypothetical protein
MKIREILNNVVAGAKRLLQQVSYDAPNMEAVFEKHFFSEFYYLYPNVSSTTFSSKTNIPQIKIDQFIMDKYGLDFFQLCNKYRIEHILSKNPTVVSENNFSNFSLKGTGFTKIEEFTNALNEWAYTVEVVEGDPSLRL